MGWKTFFKPTIVKVAIFLLLMGGLNYLIISSTRIFDARILVGLPLGFWPIGGFMVAPGMPEPPTIEFSWVNFIIDIIFWYLISCGVVAMLAGVNLQRRKRQKQSL